MMMTTTTITKTCSYCKNSGAGDSGSVLHLIWVRMFPEPRIWLYPVDWWELPFLFSVLYRKGIAVIPVEN